MPSPVLADQIVAKRCIRSRILLLGQVPAEACDALTLIRASEESFSDGRGCRANMGDSWELRTSQGP